MDNALPKITDFDFEKECYFCKMKGGLHTEQCQKNFNNARKLRNDMELKMVFGNNKQPIDYSKGCQWD